MKVDHTALRAAFLSAQSGKQSEHSAEGRANPSAWDYDYLLLRELRRDIEALLDAIPSPGGPASRIALDVGSFRSPYAGLLRARGFETRTLDLTREHGADFAGTAEATGLPDASVDLVICTQVLEHTRAPWACLREFQRIVRPGGWLLYSMPHIWFYHPHPGDYWRITQEGALALCEEAGFTVRELRLQGGSLLAFGQIVNFLAYGVLGRRGQVLYRMINAAFSVADRVVPNALFSLNIACLAMKPVDQGAR